MQAVVAINTKISAVQEVSFFVFGKCSLLGLASRGLQVALHVSGASGRFINGKLTQRPHFSIDDKVESLPQTAGFPLRQAFHIHIWRQW